MSLLDRLAYDLDLDVRDLYAAPLKGLGLLGAMFVVTVLVLGSGGVR